MSLAPAVSFVRSSKGLLFLIATLATGCSSSPACTAGERSPSQQVRAAITADPNPVPATTKMGTTQISWDTVDGSWGQVFLSAAGGPEELFGEGPKGVQNAPWISPHTTYEFRLYAGRERKVVLSTVTVTLAETRRVVTGPEKASISASPNPVPAGSKSTTIAWNTGDGSEGEVYMSPSGRSEQLFASGASGSIEVDWISPGNTYLFRLYAARDHKRRLATVNVGQVRAAPTVSLAFLFTHYGFIGLLGLVAYVIGRGAAPNMVYGSQAEQASICVGLGLGVLAYLVFVLGLAHLLYPAPVAAGIAILVGLTYRIWPRLAGSAGSFIRRAWAFSAWLRSSPRRMGLAVIATATVLAIAWYVPVLVMPLYPPAQYDATTYHLPYAVHFVQNHRLIFIPTLQFPVFPQLNEMLFTLALLLADDVSAQLVQFMMMLFAAVVAYAWGTRLFSRRAGVWAAALWLGNPLVLFLGASAHVDIGLALFVTLSLYAFWKWLAARHEWHWLVLAAVFGGFAAGTKYLALFFLMMLGVVTLVIGVRERRYSPPLVFGLVAALVAAPWYARNMYYTGNPVFPVFTEVFGANEWDPARGNLPDVPAESPSSSSGTATAVGRALLLPAKVLGTMGSRSFTDIRRLLALPYELTFNSSNTYASFSPIYLFLFPFVLLLGLKEARLRGMVILVGVYFWFAGSHLPDPRYFVPILPVLGVASAGVVDRLFQTHRPLSRTTQAVFTVIGAAALSAPGSIYVADRVPRQGPVPTNVQQRDDYLAAQLPSYPAYKLLNDSKGDNYTVYALFDEDMAYFARGKFLGWKFGPTRFARIRGGGPEKPGLGDSEALYQWLRKFGADHFLVTSTRSKIDLPDDGFFPSHFRLIYSNQYTRLFELVEP